MAIRNPLVLVSGQVQELPGADTIPAPAVSNVISSPKTVAQDTSYVVASYLVVNSDLTVQGNVGIVG